MRERAVEHPDWEREQALAEFDRLRDALDAWVSQAPAWPPFTRARCLVERVRPRLRALELDVRLEQILVVGLVGGSGVGKSTLLNALVGQRVCKAGHERPTTRHAVIVCHPDCDPSSICRNVTDAEVVKIDAPALRHVMLVDCPDPDTRDPADGSDGAHNLEVLRAVLPQCDVLVHVASAQKYQTKCVSDELLAHAHGRQLLFAQTRSTTDDDIREHWREHLERLGFSVPAVHLVDGEAALSAQERGEKPDEAFLRLRDVLQESLAGAARHRIRRANLIGLYDDLVGTLRGEIEPRLDHVHRLESAVSNEQTRFFNAIRAHLKERLAINRNAWRSVAMRQLTAAWGGGVFSSLLRAWATTGTLARSLILLRARTPTQAVLAAGLAIGQTVGERLASASASDPWLLDERLGIADADLIRAQTVVRAHAVEAEIDPGATAAPRDLAAGSLTGELVAVSRLLSQRVRALGESAIARHIERFGSVWTHIAVEIVFCVLPAFLLLFMGYNFFYERIVLGRPLLGLDFMLHAAFWIVLWALALKALVNARLSSGVDREVLSAVDRLQGDGIISPLYSDLNNACRAIHRHVDVLNDLHHDLQRLRERLGRVEDLGLGALRVAANGAPIDQREAGSGPPSRHRMTEAAAVEHG